MGLSWQQGLLSQGAIGRFLVDDALRRRTFETDKVSVYLDGGNCTSIQARQWFYTARIANSPSPEWARSSRHNGLTSRERVVVCGDETWLDCYR